MNDPARIDEFARILYGCYSRETAYPSCQKDWVPNDATYGQCAITAMLFYDYFGGTIHRIRVEGGGTHYFNRLNGRYYDLTREQFDLYDIPLRHEPNEEMDRRYCGKNADTAKRFALLCQKAAPRLKAAGFEPLTALPEAPAPPPKRRPASVFTEDSLPKPGTKVLHKVFGEGCILHYRKGTAAVVFGGERKLFRSPKAFNDGTLTLE